MIDDMYLEVVREVQADVKSVNRRLMELSGGFSSLVAKLEERCNNNECILNEIKATLYGNSKAGLKTNLTVLTSDVKNLSEQNIQLRFIFRRYVKAIWAMGVAVLSAVVGSFIGLLKG